MSAGPELFQQIRVASPCAASWDEMTGDDRVRFCAHCRMHVYNLAEFTRPEIETLVRDTGGQFCGRLFRRRDGTLLTANCPVGHARLRRDLLTSVGMLALLFGAVSTAAAAAGPGLSRWREWSLWDREPFYAYALRWGIREQAIAGRIVIPSPSRSGS